MNDIEADLLIANARIKQLERQLADYHHMSELVNGKMAENARLRRINEKLTARAEAAEDERDAAVEIGDRLCEEVENCYGRETELTQKWRGPQAGKEKDDAEK